MKISNFKRIHEGHISLVIFASVDVETGFWFFKKKETKTLYKTDSFSSWRHLEDGSYVSGYGEKIDCLESAYKARQKLKEL